jgi:hypothetical protein
MRSRATVLPGAVQTRRRLVADKAAHAVAAGVMTTELAARDFGVGHGSLSGRPGSCYACASCTPIRFG